MNIRFHLRYIREIFANLGSFERAAKIADAYFNFPAPALEQQLSSEKKAYRYLSTVGKSVMVALLCVISIMLLWYTWGIFELPLNHTYTIILLIVGCLAVAAAASDFTKAWSIYWRVYRRESQGNSHWATLAELKTRNMLFPRDAKVTPTHLPLAFLGTRHQIAIPIKESREHKATFAPTGCGKTDSFSIWEARAYSEIGALLALDMKGEIYKYSAHYYENVYRIDFERPEYSDRIDLLSFCRPNPKHPGEDAKFAGEIASYMIGYDPNNPKGGENPFWPLSATSMLKCWMMFLAERFEHVQPADLFKVLAVLTRQAEEEAKANPKNPPPHPLHRAFMNAHNPEIRAEWSPLSTLDEKTLGNIVISMTSPIASFRDPAVQTIFTEPTNEERARGCRVVDFRDLRRKGTAIYVVVPEGQASRFYSVLGTIFGVAMNVLRRTGESKGACDTLVQLDEAGNVPLRNLREDIGVGRGRRITFSLTYQSLNQPYTQYSKDYAQSFLQSCSVKIALPGLTDESAEWFTRMLNKTTTLKRTIQDARADALDSERLDEVGVDLMSANAIRTMERYKQCLIVINQASPVLARMPESASLADPRESIPRKFVWTKEELLRATRDEISERKFYERVKTLPRLPQSPFDIEHEILVAPPVINRGEVTGWTSADEMMEARQREIIRYGESLKANPSPSTEEIMAARSSMIGVVDAFSGAPELDEKESASQEASASSSNGGKPSNGGDGFEESGASTKSGAPSGVPSQQITPTQNRPMPSPLAPPLPRPPQGSPTSAIFKRIPPERVREVASATPDSDQVENGFNVDVEFDESIPQSIAIEPPL